MPVHAFERFAQQLPGLAINPPDRIFKGIGGFFEVGGLRVQEPLALAAGFQFFQRSKVDGAELRDRLVEPGNFRLERRRPRRRLGAGQKSGLIRTGFRKLRCKLVVIDPGGLFFQPQFTHAIPQRVHARLDLQALFLQRAQRSRRNLDRVTRVREGFFATDSRFDCGVQRFPDCGDRIDGELFSQLYDIQIRPFDLLVDDLDRVIDLVDLGDALPLGVYGFLRFALALLQRPSLIGQCDFCRGMGFPDVA